MKKQPQNLDAVKAKIAKAQEQLETQLAALQTSDDSRHNAARRSIWKVQRLHSLARAWRGRPCFKAKSENPSMRGSPRVTTVKH